MQPLVTSLTFHSFMIKKCPPYTKALLVKFISRGISFLLQPYMYIKLPIVNFLGHFVFN